MRQVKKAAFALLLVCITVYALFPFYWAVVSSLKTGSEIFETDPLPKAPAWSNYVEVFQPPRAPGEEASESEPEQRFGRNIVNSVLVASTVVVLSLLLGLTASFALARVRFRGRKVLLLAVLGVSMFPQIAVLSGMFELVTWLGLYNRLPALVLSNLILTLPFTVWVLTTFMRELPKELEEAAIVDGASLWTILTRVFLPLLGPAMATTGLLAFIAAWNEFLFALTFTQTPSVQTVPVAIAQFSGTSAFETPWGLIMAASVIVTVPLIVLVLIFQRKIISGLTAGAVKG
jgi:trehalose/maltose transport system permease protein